MHRYRCGAVIILFLFLAGCAGLRPASEYSRTASFALPDPEETRLGRWLAPEIAAHPGKSGFILLPNPIEAFRMRAALAESAERTMDVQYFLIRGDDTGRLLLETFVRAADRGVRVRLLVDDFNLSGEDLDILALDAHPNIEVRLFNPFSFRMWGFRMMDLIFHLDRLKRRMHNKSFIVDNTMVIVGGRNLADEYFNAKADYVFRDLDVLGVGPVAKEVSERFDDYWNSTMAYPVSSFLPSWVEPRVLPRVLEKLRKHWEEMKSSDFGRSMNEVGSLRDLLERHFPLIWAPADVIADAPEKLLPQETRVSSPPAAALGSLASRAKEEIIFITPYFVLKQRGVDFLRTLRNRGIRVRVLTNSLASIDELAAHGGYAYRREVLLEEGVELYELKPVPDRRRRQRSFGSSPARFGLHIKAYVFDRQDVMIGSINLDPRSALLDTQITLIIHSGELAQRVASFFDNAAKPATSYHLVLERKESDSNSSSKVVWVTEKEGKEIRYEDEPEVNFWRRLKASLLSLLPIEDDL